MDFCTAPKILNRKEEVGDMSQKEGEGKELGDFLGLRILLKYMIFLILICITFL